MVAQTFEGLVRRCGSAWGLKLLVCSVVAVALACAALVVEERPAYAATTIFVTNTGDSGPVLLRLTSASADQGDSAVARAVTGRGRAIQMMIDATIGKIGEMTPSAA
jgi:hypothetical protein